MIRLPPKAGRDPNWQSKEADDKFRFNLKGCPREQKYWKVCASRGFSRKTRPARSRLSALVPTSSTPSQITFGELSKHQTILVTCRCGDLRTQPAREMTSVLNRRGTSPREVRVWWLGLSTKA